MTGQWFEDCWVFLAAVFGGLALPADAVVKPQWVRVHAVVRVHTRTPTQHAGGQARTQGDGSVPAPLPVHSGDRCAAIARKSYTGEA